MEEKEASKPQSCTRIPPIVAFAMICIGISGFMIILSVLSVGGYFLYNVVGKPFIFYFKEWAHFFMLALTLCCFAFGASGYISGGGKKRD